VDIRIKDLDLISKVLNRAILIHDILYTIARGDSIEELINNPLP
jgi:hypothetical protein